MILWSIIANQDALVFGYEELRRLGDYWYSIPQVLLYRQLAAFAQVRLDLTPVPTTKDPPWHSNSNTIVGR